MLAILFQEWDKYPLVTSLMSPCKSTSFQPSTTADDVWIAFMDDGINPLPRKKVKKGRYNPILKTKNSYDLQ